MTYPEHAAGFKGDPNGPGAGAAAAYRPQLSRRRAQVLRGLEQGPGTAEQIGKRVFLDWFLTRPRLSELKALGLAIETGERGRSAFGGSCSVWRQTTPAEREAFLIAKAAEGAHD